MWEKTILFALMIVMEELKLNNNQQEFFSHPSG